MASQAQRGIGIWPQRETGRFQPNRQERHFYVTGEKIAFNNSVKGDPREERNIPQSRETAFDEITKALPSKVWQSCRTFPTRDGGNENVRRSER